MNLGRKLIGVNGKRIRTTKKVDCENFLKIVKKKKERKLNLCVDLGMIENGVCVRNWREEEEVYIQSQTSSGILIFYIFFYFFSLSIFFFKFNY